jgi:hypothetical protein
MTRQLHSLHLTRRLTGLALIALPPFAAAGAQALGVRHVALSVPARDSNWTSTELTVDEGDLIAVRVAGTVVVGVFSREVDANGLAPGTSAGVGNVYLELRIGAGRATPIGRSGSHEALTSGELQFRVHDVRYDDNAGTFHVDVVVVPATAIPHATAPEDPPALATTEALDAMRRFLKLLATAEEAYFVEHTQYASAFGELGVRPQEGLAVDRLTVATKGAGWSAIVRHDAAPNVRCAAAVNTVNPFDRTAEEMQVVCR